MRPLRVAEMVADSLRASIVSGQLRDGDILPKEDDLRLRFTVGKPAMREAMRILETEGLVTIRRGNRGGAVVHRPKPSHAAYTMALVFAAEGTTLGDVAKALSEMEPACAALCARREDRHEAVVPVLRSIQQQVTEADIDDAVAATTGSRQFHSAVIELCGNQALTVAASALEAVWWANHVEWAEHLAQPDAAARRLRRKVLSAHDEIIDLIAAGDAEGVRRMTALHLTHAQPRRLTTDETPVDVTLLRRRLAPVGFSENGR